MIPQHTKEALDRYVEHGLDTGSFLCYVLSNDLFGAMGHADQENARAIKEICQYIYCELPSACWGSKEMYINWIKSKQAVAALI